MTATIRGPAHTHIIIRLADEGVPVKAIARALRRDYDEVMEVLEPAVSSGQLLALPANDWPQGSRVARERAVRPISLTSLETVVGKLQLIYRLTLTEAKFLAALLRRPEVTKHQLHCAISGSSEPQTDPKMVDVIKCKALAKLKKHEIDIALLWGRGYALPPADRARIEQHIHEFDEANRGNLSELPEEVM